MPRHLTILVAVLSLAVAATAADPKAEALKLIDQARTALEADKAQEAIDTLQKAINLIQKSMVKGYAAYLPEAWEGWEGKEPTSNSGVWGDGEETFQWTNLEREYRRKSDDLGVDVNFSSMPQMVMGVRATMEQVKNPMFREMMLKDSETTTEFIDADGWLGWFQVHKDSNSECLAVHQKVMITIRVDKEDLALLKKFWEAIDRKGLAAATSK